MMKHVLILIVTLLLGAGFCAPSQATPVTSDMANAFYKSCLGKQDQRMSPDTQKSMCACNAAMIMKNMSVEEIQTMKENTQEGRNMLNKMLLDVYAPCMNYPVHDLVFGECLRNESLNKAGIALPRQQICGCMATKMSLWFTKEGGALMRKILEEQPNVYDPIGPIMDSQEFKSQSYSTMMSCLNHGG